LLTLKTKGDSDGGALSFRVKNGTAKGCSIKGDSITAKSAGTCIVTATRQARGAAPKVSSKPVAIHFDLTLTIDFGSRVSSLGTVSMAAIANFAKSLRAGDTVVCTGYAKGDRVLASSRAASVARYLATLVRVHVTMKSVTNGADNKAVLAT
jgi:hypothetical protein